MKSCRKTLLPSKQLQLGLILTVVVGWLLGPTPKPAFAEDSASSPTVQPAIPSPEQLAQWAANLDDNQFAMRESAEQKLKDAGLPALEQVAEAARNGSLESSTRALNILLSWSETSDRPDLRMSALQEIVTLANRPQESRVAGEVLAEVQEEAALARIVELGGLHTRDSQSGVPIVNLPGGAGRPIQVVIGMQWKGGVQGLELLHDVRRATTLSFHSAPLGDELVPVLLDLPQLRRIEIYGTKVSSGTIEELQKKLPPYVTLAVRGGALLGVQGDPRRQNGALVIQVSKDSAAEKAGIKAQDLITEFEGTKIADFTELTSRIAERTAGDTVTLKVVRSVDRAKGKTRELEIQVTFDQWGANNKVVSLLNEKKSLQVDQQKPRKIQLDRR